MKLLTALCLAGVLMLAGCAGLTPPVGPDQLRTGDSVFPGGALSPIEKGTTPGSAVVAPLSPPTDMWDRIRRGFKMANLEGELVTDREQWYRSRPDYLERMTSRSDKYLFYIVEELERRGMPTELALLPFIESAFNPQAVSSAKAAGMWQFMPATGSDYQLKQNIFRDDRRDVVASTRAALDYLQKLHDMFGDWQLALASYNWGEGNVARAIAKNQKAGLPTGYTDLSMPAETRLYVPKLQAVKNLVAHPEQFGAELPFIANHPYFQSVAITHDLDVDLAARLADIKVEAFRALNPSAHKPVILAAGTPEILLPWDNAAVFKRNLAAYGEGQYASWTAWTAPTTLSVAAASQQTGMSESDLRSINGIPPRMLIKAGSTLIVPRSGRVKEDVAAAVADSGHLSFQPEIVTRRTTVRARRNESVASLARRYGVAAGNVADWNDVKTGSTFKNGYKVIVYLPVKAASVSRVGSGSKRRGRVLRAGAIAPRAASVKRTSAAGARAVTPTRAKRPSSKKRR